MPPEWTDPERLTVIGLLVIVIVSGMRRDWLTCLMQMWIWPMRRLFGNIRRGRF